MSSPRWFRSCSARARSACRFLTDKHGRSEALRSNLPEGRPSSDRAQHVSRNAAHTSFSMEPHHPRLEHRRKSDLFGDAFLSTVSRICVSRGNLSVTDNRNLPSKAANAEPTGRIREVTQTPVKDGMKDLATAPADGDVSNKGNSLDAWISALEDSRRETRLGAVQNDQ